MTEDKPPVLISEETIRARVAELARAISIDYADAEELVLVGVLRGAFIFLADISRLLTVPTTVDFVALESYGPGSTPAADVRGVMDLRVDIAGKHVLVVEDIVDSGRTLRRLLSSLVRRRPASLRTCALLRKPDRADPDIPVDYVGFDVPDAWIVGYGLDDEGRYRGLPYLGSTAERR